MPKIMSFEDFRANFSDDIMSMCTTDLGVTVYPPNFVDLYSLYTQTRQSKTIAVLEFGAGWSTLAFEIALRENKEDCETAGGLAIRHPNPFHIMTIDCSNDFLSLALKRIPPSGITIKPVITLARMAEVDGKICTLYDSFPAFTADLIYIDGPDCDPSQVYGDVDGFNLNFGSDGKIYGLPMAGDLIRVEQFLWPGTKIITDGRGAQANFLKDNFRRNWNHIYDEKLDQHILSLDEPAWGEHSRALLRMKSLNTTA